MSDHYNDVGKIGAVQLQGSVALILDGSDHASNMHQLQRLRLFQILLSSFFLISLKPPLSIRV